MQTPWGDLPVSDAHIHFFSHGFFSALAAERKAPFDELQSILDWELPPEDPAQLADHWVAELDRHGVSTAVLMASVPGDEASVAAAVERHPDRLHGYFMINPTQRSIETNLATALASGALRGICLFPAMHHYSLHDTRLTPVFEIAASHGTVVFVHCGALSVGVRKKLALPSQFDMRHSNPLDLHAIALQFPKVNFVLPHFGAGLFRETLMLCDLCPNVHLDTSSSNKWMSYEGLDLQTVFARALAVCGPDRLLFGTDSSFFPRGWNAAIFQKQVKALDALNIPAASAAKILGANLQRLLTPA